MLLLSEKRIVDQTSDRRAATSRKKTSTKTDREIALGNTTETDLTCASKCLEELLNEENLKEKKVSAHLSKEEEKWKRKEMIRKRKEMLRKRKEMIRKRKIGNGREKEMIWKRKEWEEKKKKE